MGQFPRRQLSHFFVKTPGQLLHNGTLVLRGKCPICVNGAHKSGIYPLECYTEQVRLLPCMETKAQNKEMIIVKKEIHPDYVDCTVTCTCGNSFQTRSTKPELRVDICNACHPFFTGTQKLIDTGGRVQRFADKFGNAKETLAAREAEKKAKRAEEVEAAEAAKKAEREEKAAAKAKRAEEYAKKAEKQAAREAQAAAEAGEAAEAATEEAAEASAEAAEAAAEEATEAAAEETAEVAEEAPAEEAAAEVAEEAAEEAPAEETAEEAVEEAAEEAAEEATEEAAE